MPTVKLTGYILPEPIKLTIGLPLNVDWYDSEDDRNVELTVKIVRSKITITCYVSKYSDDYFIKLYIKALDITKSLVDVMAFKDGRGLSVHLTQWVDVNGGIHDIIIEDPTLPPLVRTFKSFSIPQVVNIVLTEPPIHMALNDLILAITLPHHAPVNCARAVEGIRHLIIGPGKDQKLGWAMLREMLNVDEAYLKMITSNSTENRHGNRVRISGEITMEVTKRAWIIMDRFLQYRLRNSGQLPLNEFPLLQG